MLSFCQPIYRLCHPVKLIIFTDYMIFTGSNLILKTQSHVTIFLKGNLQLDGKLRHRVKSVTKQKASIANAHMRPKKSIRSTESTTYGVLRSNFAGRNGFMDTFARLVLPCKYVKTPSLLGQLSGEVTNSLSILIPRILCNRTRHSTYPCVITQDMRNKSRQ